MNLIFKINDKNAYEYSYIFLYTRMYRYFMIYNVINKGEGLSADLTL